MAAKKYVQALTQYLAGSGVIIGATSIVLTSLTDIYGNAITSITSFGDKGYITLESDTTNEEAATFTSVTVNANGTVTLGGISTALAQSPYTETSGLVRAHSGGTKVVITDNVAFWNTFGNKNNDEVITGRWSTTTVPVNPNDIATKSYADGLAIAGAPNASTTVKGIGKVSVAPVSPTNPIFVGQNDPFLPPINTSTMTAGQVAALAGNNGTPGAGNTFVTQTGLIGIIPAYFGDGSDGTVTFDGAATILGLVPIANVYTLTRDLLLNTGTVNNGVTLKLNGFQIFASVLLTNNGIISNDGGVGTVGVNGVDAGGATTGGAGGTATSAGSVVASIAGVAGGNGGAAGTNNGSAGTTGNNATNCVVTAVAAGGGGGAGSSGSNAGGAGGAVGTTTSTYKATLKNPFQAFSQLLSVNSQAGSGAGGGGAGGVSDGTNTASGGSGGGSGATGGTTFIAATSLTNGATGIIRANGGNGGNGGTGQRRSGGGGGGASGGGGIVITVTHTLTNAGTIQANSGTAGTGGAKGSGDGSVGINGVTAVTGTVISILN